MSVARAGAVSLGWHQALEDRSLLFYASLALRPWVLGVWGGLVCDVVDTRCRWGWWRSDWGSILFFFFFLLGFCALGYSLQRDWDFACLWSSDPFPRTLLGSGTAGGVCGVWYFDSGCLLVGGGGWSLFIGTCILGRLMIVYSKIRKIFISVRSIFFGVFCVFTNSWTGDLVVLFWHRQGGLCMGYSTI